MKTASALLVLAISAPAAASSASMASARIATVVQHGGLCYRGAGRPATECRRNVTITDQWISAPDARRHALGKTERASLLAAIGEIEPIYLRAHPFRGVCPTAYDGQESIYRFRGFDTRLPSCTYDLRGVRAVTLVNRLISQLNR